MFDYRVRRLISKLGIDENELTHGEESPRASNVSAGSRVLQNAAKNDQRVIGLMQRLGIKPEDLQTDVGIEDIEPFGQDVKKFGASVQNMKLPSQYQQNVEQFGKLQDTGSELQGFANAWGFRPMKMDVFKSNNTLGNIGKQLDASDLGSYASDIDYVKDKTDDFEDYARFAKAALEDDNPESQRDIYIYGMGKTDKYTQADLDAMKEKQGALLDEIVRRRTQPGSSAPKSANAGVMDGAQRFAHTRDQVDSADALTKKVDALQHEIDNAGDTRNYFERYNEQFEEEQKQQEVEESDRLDELDRMLRTGYTADYSRPLTQEEKDAAYSERESILGRNEAASPMDVAMEFGSDDYNIIETAGKSVSELIAERYPNAATDAEKNGTALAEAAAKENEQLQQDIETLKKYDPNNEGIKQRERQIAANERIIRDVGYHQLQFAEDFAQGVKEGGKKIKFTTNMFSLGAAIDGMKGTPTTFRAVGDPVWSNLTKTEQDIYKYLLYKDPEKAEEYMDSLKDDTYGVVAKRRAKGMEEVNQDIASENPFLSTAYTVLTQPIRTAMGMGYSTYNSLTDNETSPYSAWMEQTNMSQQIRGKVAENIDEATKDSPVWNFISQALYTTGTSLGDSLMSGMFGKWGLALMGLDSAQQTINSALESGATQEEAELLGTLTGAIEVATEKLPFDEFLNAWKGVATTGKDGVKTAIKKIFKTSAGAGISDAAGETVAEVLGNAVDNVIMGDRSQREQSIQAYMAENPNATREEAEGVVIAEEWKQYAMAAVSGFISSGASTLAGATTNYIQQRSAETKAQAEAKAAETGEAPVQSAEAVAQEAAAEGAYNNQQEQQEYAEAVARMMNGEAPAAEQEEGRVLREQQYEKQQQPMTAADLTGEQIAYEYGEMGRPQEEMLETLQEVGIEASPKAYTAYTRGETKRQQTVFERKQQIAELNKGGKNGTRKGVLRSISKGEVQMLYEKGITVQEFSGGMSEKQTAATNALRKVAETMHLNMVLYESPKGENGERVGANGFYDSDNNTVYLDVFAGKGNEQAIMKAAAHELTHVIQEWAPEHYKNLQDGLIKYFYSEGKSTIKEMVQAQMEKAKKAGMEITEAQAMDEVTADACEMMFGDIDAMSEIAATDRTLFEKVGEWINKFVDTIKKAMEGLRAGTRESELLMHSKEAWENARKTWYAALEVAGKNNPGTVTKTETSAMQPAETATEAPAVTKTENPVRIVKPAETGKTVKEMTYEKPAARKVGKTVTEKVNGEDVTYQYALMDINDLKVPEGSGRISTTGMNSPSDLNIPNVDEYGNLPGANMVVQMVGDKTPTGRKYTMQYRGWMQKNADLYGFKQSELRDNDVLVRIRKDGNANTKTAQETVQNASEAVQNASETVQNAKAKEVTDKNAVKKQLIAKVMENGVDQQTEAEMEKTGIYVRDESSVSEHPVDVINGAAVKFSLRTWTEAEKVKVKDGLIKAGYAEKNVEKWINDANGIAAQIAQDKERLDFEAADNQTMLKDNQEYKKTLDASTLCAKRLLYQGTFDKVQHMLPDRVLSSDDLIELRNMLKDKGYESPCAVCYVESRRRFLGKFAQEWLDEYKGAYKPHLDEVTTSDGLEELRFSHPQTYKDFVDAMNKKGSNNPKVVQLRTDYRGDIRKLTKSQIQKILDIGGLRVQSFSDFETPHLLDMMQAVMDMASMKLTSQAYTKVPNFAAVFGDTGIKINLSLIAEGTGLDADGNLIFSSYEGMDFNEAMKLRDQYSENVGTIIVGISDAHIKAAMADDRIDFIIPFHKSGWGEKQMLQLGINTDANYEAYQNERRIVGYYKNGKPKYKNVESNFYPADYWDYNKTGKENAETYLRMCAEDGRVPKFEQFLTDNGDGSYSLPEDGSADGYWKMLIDFKMYDNDGVGAPQKTVQPKFNMEEAMRVLAEYEGGANTLPVANDVAEEYVQMIKDRDAEKSDIRFSQRDYEAYMTTEEEEYYNYGPYYVRNVSKATSKTLTRMLELQEKVKKNKLNDANFVEATEEAESHYARMKQDGENIEDYLAKNKNEMRHAETKTMMRLFAKYDGEDRFSSDKLANVLDYMADVIEDRWEKGKTEFTLENVIEEAEEWIRKEREAETEWMRSLDGYESDIRFSQRDTEYKTDRQLLAGALESAAATEEEKQMLKQYQQTAAEIDKYDDRVREINKKIREIRTNTGKWHSEEEVQLVKERNDLEKRIEKADKKLMSLQEMRPIRQLANRQRKEFARGKLDKYREGVVQREYIARIKTTSDRLSKWLTKPTNQRYVPEAMRKPLAEFLLAIDRGSETMLTTGGMTKADRDYARVVADLRDVIRNISAYQNDQSESDKVFNMHIDLPRGFEELMTEHAKKIEARSAEMGGRMTLNRMNTQELEELFKTLTAISSTITHTNDFLSAENAKHVSEVSQETIDYLREQRAVKTESKLGEFLNWDNVQPIYAFERYGEGGKRVFKMLQNGQSKLAMNTNEIVKLSKELYTAKEAKQWSEEIKTFEIGGKEVQIPVANIMSLYCLMRRQQGIGHLYGEGIRVGDFKIKGKMMRDTGHNVGDADIARMIGSLTERQKDVAEKLQSVMSTVGSRWGNEISMKRFGYRMFTEQNYFPIEVDKTHLPARTDNGRGNELYRLLNISSTKPITRGANNRIMLNSIFDVYSSHMSDMAQYNAMALPVLDAVKWLNYKESELEELGLGEVKEYRQKYTESVRDAARDAYGYAANKYIIGVLRDINGTQMTGDTNENFGKMMLGRANRASVAANLRVAFLQPLSIVRAGIVLNTPDILKGMGMGAAHIKKNIQEMNEYSGIAQWKDLGFYDVNIGRSVAKLIKNDKTTMDKLIDATMKMPEWADKITWSLIWESAKKNVARTVDPNSSEFMQKVAERFEEVIYQTQVVDSVLTKSQFMRGTSFVSKSLSSFMSEPMVSYNMLLKAYNALASETNKTNFQQAWKKHGNMVLRTMSVYTVASAVSALVESLVGAWRDDDDYETFMEKFKDGFFDNFVNNMSPFNKVPIVKDLYEYAKKGAALLGVDTFGYDTTNPLYKWADQLFDGLVILKDIVSGKKTNFTGYGMTYKLMQGISSGTGIPIANAMRDGAMIWNNTIGYMTGNKIQVYKTSKSTGYQQMYNAIQAGNEQRAEEIRTELKENGADDKGIASGLRSLAKTDYLNNDLTDAEAEEFLTKYCGMDEDKAFWQLEEWRWDAQEEAESYSVYAELEEALLTGEGVEEAVSKLEEHGYEDKVESKVREIVKKGYLSGELTKTKTAEALKKYGGLDDNEVYFKQQQYEYERMTGDSTSSDACMIFYAIDLEKSPKEAIDAAIAHGKTKSGLASSLTSRYKQQYLELLKTNKSAAYQLGTRLAGIFDYLGYKGTEKVKGWETSK